MTLPIAISTGDPAGVGPMIALSAAKRLSQHAFAIYGDARRLERAARDLGIDASRRVRVDPAREVLPSRPGAVALVHAAQVTSRTIEARAPTPEGGIAQLRALELATHAVKKGKARALVTGPTSKAAVTMGDGGFTGHTEWLALADGLEEDSVTMMFLGPRLRVAVVTTHVPLRRAPDMVTVTRACRTIVHLGEALVRLGTTPASVVVTGLNPHAGEHGLLGEEEDRVLAPSIERARRREPFRAKELILEGPRPAETVFREAANGAWGGVVTMYHDQATIASKLLDWGSAVNVTWGLSFVRTSVDHGVAYDAAAEGKASDEEGMVAAIEMAHRLEVRC